MDVYQDWSMDQVVSLIDACSHPAVVGIAGPPAAGKSTFCEDLCFRLNQEFGSVIAQPCPMDGFHLPTRTLDEIGLARFKGRIDTFDVEGYVSSIRRLRNGERNFYWPIYSRVLHDPVEEGIWIEDSSRIFVTEGNYLLNGSGYWRALLNLIDLKIFLAGEEEVLVERLVHRHIQGGKSPEEADEKIQGTDLPNVRLIARSRDLADVVLGRRKIGDFERWHQATQTSPGRDG